MNIRISWPTDRKETATSVLIFVAVFAWFWFWRPYGLYGGDSDQIEFNTYRGLWIRKREPLSMALFQLSHQVLSRGLGWPVGNSISFISSLFGASAMVVLWKATLDFKRSRLIWVMLLCSGYSLTFYGAIEFYAVPIAMIAFWILAIHRVARGSWQNWTIPLAFAGTCFSHLFGLLLFPCLCVSAYILWSRLTTRDRWIWLEFVFSVPFVFLLIDLGSPQEGNSFASPLLEALAPGPGQPNFLPLWSLKHITIKGYFLWLGTGIALPFAVWKVWRDRYDPVTLQVAAMAGMALVFLALFHPDLGYDDWDLFLFPSLPVAFLAAPVVAQSPKRVILSTIWIGIFITLWLPRIPFWANLSERGLAEVRILNPPADARVRLDDRYPVEGDRVWMGGGMHSLSVWRHGDRIRWKVFRVHPGEELEIRLPEGRAPGPFAEQIKRMQLERDEETRFDQSP